MNAAAPMRAAPDLAPVVVRVVVPPLRPEPLPAPAVVTLAVPALPPRAGPPPPLPQRKVTTAVTDGAAPAPHAPRGLPDLDRLRGYAADWWGRAPAWARRITPGLSALLGLLLLLALGEMAGAGYGDGALWLHWLATLGGAAWGWGWWRARPLLPRLLALCGGVVLFRTTAILAFLFLRPQPGGVLDLLYQLAWAGLLLLGLWIGGAALARRLAPLVAKAVRRPAGEPVAVSGDLATPTLIERITSGRVVVEGVSPSGVQRIRMVSAADRIKTIYWSLRLVWLLVSVTFIALYYDSILAYLSGKAGQNAWTIVKNFFGGAFR